MKVADDYLGGGSGLVVVSGGGHELCNFGGNKAFSVVIVLSLV